MRASLKKDLLITGVALGLVALWAFSSKAATPGGYQAVTVSSGVQELAAAAGGNYAFHLPSGGAFLAANLSTLGRIDTLPKPASGPLLVAGVPPASLLTIVWTLGGVQWTTVYTVQ